MNNNPINKNRGEEKSFGYVPYDDDNLGNSIESFTSTGEEISHASYYSLKNLLPNISARPSFTREDYEYFRPNEALPKKYKDIIMACDAIYIYNGLIRHVVDLMSDFACQGICLSHPVKSIQKFYEDWFRKVKGPERSERFLSCLYRHNMVTISIANAKFSKNSSLASREIDNKNLDFEMPPNELKFEKTKYLKGKLPLQYTFLYPAWVDPKKMTYGKPEDIFNASKSVPLDIENTKIYFYKKDDWMVKPIPFLYPLIQHAIMIDKLNLADNAALDGATSRLRFIKLGNPDKGLYPGPALVSKLDQILRSNVGGGSQDIIWGPDIDLLESKVEVSSFLGDKKFKPHTEQLYVGLGVPPTLVGSGGGTTNNLMALKTFIQRLIYGREQLTHFWTEQVIRVQKAMGFSRPATIEYDFMDLGEEAAHRKLLLDMADRNIISEERLLKLLNHDPDMEKIRINREQRERRGNRRAQKTSPWHDPQFDVAMKKIALQKGYITPEQAGIELEEEKRGEKTPFDTQIEVMKMKGGGGGQPPSNKKAGTPGRPTGSKDSEKRKQKTFNPRVKAAQEVWVQDAYSKISQYVKPLFFDAVGKKDLRELTNEEFLSFEEIKFTILCNVKPFSDIDMGTIQKHLLSKNGANYKVYKDLCQSVQKDIGRKLKLDELRQIQTFVYLNNVV